MEQITRIVQQIGNGGHIYLPKEIVGQKVVINLIEKSMEDIEEEILHILKPCLKNIKGIYIYGSYARGEQTPESDIDILVITDGKVKIKKRINEYDIVSLSLEQVEKTIGYTAVLILPMLKEARTILNQELVERYKKERLTKKNTRWYIETTESSLKLAKDWIGDKDSKSMQHIVYPLIMRLRGLHLIESLIRNKGFSNRQVSDYMTKKGLSLDKTEQLNRMYREHRDKRNISGNSLDYGDISKLYSITYRCYMHVKSLWEKLR